MIRTKIKRSENLALVFTQIVMMIISTFAFSFIVGGMIVGVTPKVIAADSVVPSIPKGCCPEAKDGSICQEMNLFDKAMCKTDLLSTSCNTVDNCQIGCCYDPSQGICSLNSPKQKCLSNGGNWSNNAQCNIQECQVGCCVLGDQASITTTRECTKVSRDLNLQKNFQPLDADGTCSSKTGLSKTGACTSSTNDFSGENDCKFTTKEQCATGNFYEGFLCTAPELHTVCLPAKNTTCVEGKDQVYYLDTCGNLANVYDSSKFSDASYWTKIILPKDSCSAAGKDCGNCDYVSGSRCYAVRDGRDPKPTYGNNVCRDLNCENGKKHGESWCIGDYSNLGFAGVSPIGSRFFRGTCVEGEINIEPCADFNNEICISNTATGDGQSSFSEAQCVPNNWRSCLAANSKESYAEVKEECDKYPNDCIMFSDIPGNEQISDSKNGLPGFKKDVENNEQGKAGDVGKDMNKVISHCVPKYTPGMVFWSDTKNSSKSSSNLGSGGSLEETTAICALGSFTCVAHKAKSNAVDSWSWKDNELCSNYGPDSEKWITALNQRCASLGPCGGQINIAGEIGKNNLSTFMEIKIDKGGGMGKPYSPEKYVVSQDSINALVEKSGLIKVGSLSSLASAVILSLITGNAISTDSTTAGQEAKSTIKDNNKPLYTEFGALGSVGLLAAGTKAAALWGYGAYVSYAGVVLVVAAAAYVVGQLLGKAFGFDGPTTNAFSNALAAGAALATIGVQTGLLVGATTTTTAGGAVVAGTSVAATSAASGTFGFTTLGGFAWCWICLVVIIIIMILTYIFTYEADEYYIMSYTCSPWQAPKIGDCSLCNNDIRTCSEYRCKSLGQNCQYFNTNGEPGWCAQSSETWSAKITPWPKALSEGNTYTDVSDNHFTISGNAGNGKVEAWKNLQFGIMTDKPAQCRIDNKHTKSFDEMSTSFAIASETCTSGTCSSGSSQGTYHKIALSENLGNGTSGDSTLGMVEGENNYYIRCQNFAGQSNAAEFAVKLVLSEGPDLTPPIVNSFTPISGSYLKVGTNSTTMIAYVNEPSECRYSQKVDNRYEEMTGNLTCITSPNMAILGNWPCYATLKNFETGENKFYLQCKDQPNIDERVSSTRNINRNSKEYTLNLCSTGLNITSLEPQNQIITGKSPIATTLTATTSGCIDGGRATCYYQFNGGSEIAFLNTNAKMHSQTFDNLPSGDNNITVKCADDAGNTATGNITIKVFIDSQAPNVIRAFDSNNKLTMITDENAECRYIQNSSIGCDFNFYNANYTIMEDNGRFHYAQWIDNKDYYIKCTDVYNNTNFGCGIALRTY